MKTILVVGSAPCLHDDVARALELRPDAEIMLVNGAATAIEKVAHVLAGHSYKAEQFAKQRRKVFPNAPVARMHATVTEKHLGEAKIAFPSVTDWWDKSYAQGATSIAKGAEIGFRGLGFDEVILCGAPLDGSGYFIGECTQVIDCIRVGDPSSHTGWGPTKDQRHRVIDGYRRKFKEKFAPRYPGRLFSMSGFTREIVGEPKR